MARRHISVPTLLDRVREPVPAIGPDVSRRHHVHADSERSQVHAKRLHHRVHAALGRDVREPFAAHALRRVRSHEHDRAALVRVRVALLLHEETVARRLHHAETAEDVDVQHGKELLVRHLQRTAMADAHVRGIGDDHVEPSRLAFDHVHHGRHLAEISHVADNRREA